MRHIEPEDYLPYIHLHTALFVLSALVWLPFGLFPRLGAGLPVDPIWLVLLAAGGLVYGIVVGMTIMARRDGWKQAVGMCAPLVIVAVVQIVRAAYVK